MTSATIEPPAEPTPLDAETMQAVVQDEYGIDTDAVLRVDEVPVPVPGDDEILVRVRAASVDMGTWHVMAGLPYPMRLAGFGLRRPNGLNPGRSFAGTVVSCGSEVTGFSPGDSVYGIGNGSFAEFTTAPATKVAPMPQSLSFEQAAAVPISGLTALQAVRDQAGATDGQRMLIIGASGGVGTFAVQIAKALGADVTGVASTAKVDLVRDIGADHVIDYTTEDYLDGERRYDAIVDIGGNNRLSHLRRALTPNGRLIITGGETDGRWLGGTDRQLRAMALSPFVGQHLGTFISSENADDLRALTELIDSGRLTPTIDRTYPLSEAATAIRHVKEGRARGKVVVVV